MNRLPSPSVDSLLGVPEFPEILCQNEAFAKFQRACHNRVEGGRFMPQSGDVCDGFAEGWLLLSEI